MMLCVIPVGHLAISRFVGHVYTAVHAFEFAKGKPRRAYLQSVLTCSSFSIACFAINGNDVDDPSKGKGSVAM